MPTALLLRFCLCSLLVLTLIVDTAAQRASRRRSAPATDTSAVEKSPVQLNIFKYPCEKRQNTLVLEATTMVQTKSIIQKDTVIRHELKTTPGKLFSRADLVRSQRELSNLLFVKKDNPVKEVLKEDAKKAIPPDCRETNMINKPGIAEAYPYLTGDGLRLYFTSNRESLNDRLFISTRKSINDPFSEPKVLSKALIGGYYAGTLTADERTLCMVHAGDMYISVRSSENEEFPLPVKIEGATPGYHFGPSISQDGTEIFVTADIAGQYITRIYRRTGVNTVEEESKLDTPKCYQPGPGQLSKDGLSYYLSLKNESSYHLWKYLRASTADNFTNPVELPEPMAGLKNSIQPSLNADGSILVFVTSPNNYWGDDDIILVNTFKNNFVYPKIADSIVNIAGNTVKLIDKISSPPLIAYPDILDIEFNQSNQSSAKVKGFDNNNGSYQLKVYPNPFVNSVNIKISEVPEHGALFNLYDLSGRIIKQQKINDLQTRVSLNQLLAGVYTYQVMDEKGKLVASGKLVKQQ